MVDRQTKRWRALWSVVRLVGGTICLSAAFYTTFVCGCSPKLEHKNKTRREKKNLWLLAFSNVLPVVILNSFRICFLFSFFLLCMFWLYSHQLVSQSAIQLTTGFVAFNFFFFFFFFFLGGQPQKNFF